MYNLNLLAFSHPQNYKGAVDAFEEAHRLDPANDEIKKAIRYDSVRSGCQTSNEPTVRYSLGLCCVNCTFNRILILETCSDAMEAMRSSAPSELDP
jgi:hypothetical protein